MILQEQYNEQQGWYWTAQGEGPIRPIAVEGQTRKEARENWISVFANQYAEGETMTANSISWQQECREDLG